MLPWLAENNGANADEIREDFRNLGFHRVGIANGNAGRDGDRSYLQRDKGMIAPQGQQNVEIKVDDDTTTAGQGQNNTGTVNYPQIVISSLSVYGRLWLSVSICICNCCYCTPSAFIYVILVLEQWFGISLLPRGWQP